MYAKLVFPYLCGLMKKKTIFFFFLLVFTGCSQKGNNPLLVHPGTGSILSLGSGNQASAGNARYPLSSSPVKPDPPQVGTGIKRHGGRSKANIPEHLLTREARDSIFIERLNYLRQNKIEADLNEPVSQRFLFSPAENLVSPSLVTLGSESILTINFDNDILDYTDRFYTNGIKIELIAPALRANPAARALVPYWHAGRNYYGLSLVQNMYTPSTTKIGGILFGDRPYAAYLYLGSFRITLDPVRHIRQTSEIDLGVIGPQSYGEWVQRTFHKDVPTNSEPLGWEYQIKNDLVLNYSVRLEKGIVNRKSVELILSSSADLGTLYTNLSGGFQFRTGLMNPYFDSPGILSLGDRQKPGARKFQFVFFVKGSGKFAGYDATLEGGLINRSSVYTIPSIAVSRCVLQGSSGISLGYNGCRLDLEQFILSPEFHNGWWHKWVHIALVFGL